MSTNKVNLFEQVLGYYRGTKAAIEALTGVPTGSLAFATNTNEVGNFNGSAWTWGQVYTVEFFQDIVGGMIIGTQTGIQVTYNDPSALLNFVVDQTGWVSKSDTWTYVSADDPVYQIYVSGNAVTNPDYNLGNKIKCTNNSITFYGFIVKVGSYDSGNDRTPVDVYGGTDYDLANSAITAPFISKAKSPDGFPMDPTKWQVVVTDTSNRSQANPAQNTWYNLGSISITIPIGIWKVSYKVCLRGDVNGTAANCFGTLSTANNSESDGEFTTETQFIGATATLTSTQCVAFASKFLALTSKTTYYLNSRTTVNGQSAINNRNDVVKLLITVDCAYL